LGNWPLIQKTREREYKNSVSKTPPRKVFPSTRGRCGPLWENPRLIISLRSLGKTRGTSRPRTKEAGKGAGHQNLRGTIKIGTEARHALFPLTGWRLTGRPGGENLGLKEKEQMANCWGNYGRHGQQTIPLKERGKNPRKGGNAPSTDLTKCQEGNLNHVR